MRMKAAFVFFHTRDPLICNGSTLLCIFWRLMLKLRHMCYNISHIVILLCLVLEALLVAIVVRRYIGDNLRGMNPNCSVIL